MTFDGQIIRTISDPDKKSIRIDLNQRLTSGAIYKFGFHVQDGDVSLEQVVIASNTHVVDIVLPCSAE